MSRLDPNAWAGRVPGALVGLGEAVRPAHAISFDSREVNPSTAFVALAGANTHGNAYIAQALAAGAPFVLCDAAAPAELVATGRLWQVADATHTLRAWARRWRDASTTTIVGVTGSAGKTTFKEFAAAALGGGCTPESKNTLNYIACHMLNQLSHDASDEAFHVIEMGIDRKGEMRELVSLVNPNIGVITSIGPAHVEFLDSVERIALEKGVLLYGRPGLVSKDSGQYYPDVPQYGFAHDNEHTDAYHADVLEANEHGVSYLFAGLALRIPTPSLKVAAASVGALGLARRFGLDLAAASDRVRRVSVPGGRMRVERGSHFTLIDDSYNANPLSMQAALASLGQLSPQASGRRVVVLGDMRELGELANTAHTALGEEAAAVADAAWLVGEWAEVVAGPLRAAGIPCQCFANGAALLAAGALAPQHGDVVLVKGSNAVGLRSVADALRRVLGATSGVTP
jgi:UDP-N-acetylmuramoyl-tripeptide--D-alanyl-D-alanine ligase